MSKNIVNNNSKTIIIGMVIGSMLTLGVYSFIAPVKNEQATSAKTAEKKPLYWVAPMDANYMKDKPGKSPMGMDLVPVYDDDGKGPDAGVGTIRISSDVVNNLGVRTSIANFSLLHSEINTMGYITFDESKIVDIHPRVQGWIEKLYVKAIGDPIKKHQALYDIYSPELVNAQEELLLALERKNSRLIAAAENRLMALQLPQSAIIKLKKTKQVQQKITFYAPQNGVVKTLNIREGSFVKPVTTLLSIADLSQVWLEAEVFERQANQVKTGTPVTMTLDYLPGRTWQGQVDYIYPTLDANTRTVKIRSSFTNVEAEFKPNMFAHIVIHSTSDEQALLIPQEALIRTGMQDRVVLALGEGSFKSIAVTVGRYDRNNVEILSGLDAGEKVVSSAQFLLDSESSKSSDFKRMHHESSRAGSYQESSDQDKPSEMDMSNNNDSTAADTVSSATVNGTVVNVMVDHRMVTIDREAIVEWGRAADRVDFIVDDNVDMTLFSNNAYVMFTFEIREGNFIIVSAMTMPKPDAVMKNAANDKGA